MIKPQIVSAIGINRINSANEDPPTDLNRAEVTKIKDNSIIFGWWVALTLTKWNKVGIALLKKICPGENLFFFYHRTFGYLPMSSFYLIKMELHRVKVHR